MNVSKRWKCVVCPVCDLSYLVQKESLGTRARTRKLPMKSSLCALTDPIWREIRFTASAAPAQEDVTRTREISPDIISYERNITRYCSALRQSFAETFFNAADNFVSGHVWPVRPKSVKVLWIFKVVERSLDILLLPKDIHSLFAGL